MSPEEITDVLETMSTTIRTLQTRGTGADSGVPAHARPPEPPKRPEPPSKDQYKELLDPASESFDPERAFRAFAEANYGQLVGDINARTIRGLYGTFRSEFPDFKDYEVDITTALQGRPAAELTEQDVLHTYLAAKGLRMTQRERAERAKAAATTMPPSPPDGGKPKEVELSALEQEVAHRMFKRIADPQERLKRYRAFAAKDEEGMTLSVPIGGGKKE
jgi:hypothetical protein